MSPKLPIRISLKQLTSLIDYVEARGYHVTKKECTDGFVQYTTNAPGYGRNTPLADVVKEGNRRKAWTYIRLPKFCLSLFP